MPSRPNLLALCGLLLAAGCATTPPDIPPEGKAERTAHALVNRATISLAEFDEGATHAALSGACAVLLFPAVDSLSFVAGGGRGSGILLVRGDTPGEWRGPAFYSLAEADIGIQAGVGERELVVVLHACDRLGGLYAGASRLRLGTLSTAQASERDEGAALSRDVKVFSRMHGLYVGAAVNGSLLRPLPALAGAFYGRPATPAQILTGPPSEEDGGQEIRDAVARATR